MELKVRDKTRSTPNRLIRYIAIALLVPLLALFISRFNDVSQLLLNLNRGEAIMSKVGWIVIVKFTSYCVHILLNFCLLLAITNRLRYSLLFVYAAFAVLLAGIILVAFRDLVGMNVPLTLIAFFVKIDKSLILLVFFIAGHIVKRKFNV